MSRTASLALAAGMLCPLGAAGSGLYEDARLIRVWPDSAREQLAVAQLEMTLMSEGVRLDGGTEYIARPEALAALAEAGVEFEVVVEDVQARIDAERARLEARTRWGEGPAPRGDDAFFAEYRDIGELETFFDQLVSAYPGLISRETIGSSVQGREIEGFTIGAPGDVHGRPSLIFNGTAHAREWISPMTVSYIMQELLEGYGTDPRVTALLEEVTFRVAPVMNPDGYVYSWGFDRYWRKTRRNNGDGTYGVDWNRNWSVGWGGAGASADTSDPTYHGPAPFSEPETRALRDWTLAIPNAAFHIDFHSYSQLILWPWGYTYSPIPEPDRTIHEDLGFAYAAAIQSTTGAVYDPIQSSDLYPAGGDSSDWYYDQAGVFSFTVELRPASSGQGGFDPPPSIILPTARENYEAVLGLAETVAAGVSASFLGGRPLVVEPGVGTEVSIEILPAFSGELDPGSATLLARVGASGPFEATAMSASGDVYTGTLPAAPCGGTIEYYVEIDSLGGVTYSVPPGAPNSVFDALVLESTVAIEDDMESDTGWTVGAPGDTATTGVWERADPQGTDAQPENDHTIGGTMCWVTGAAAGSSVGAFDIDGGVTTLTSPVLDATGPGDAYLSFWVWYSNDQGASPGSDSMPVRISNDGGQTWQTLDVISSSTNAWVERSYLIADAVAPTSQVRVRFEASDLGDGSIVEAAVDDLRVELLGCAGNPADLAPPFGVLDLADVQAFVDAFVNGEPLADLSAPFGVLDLADVQLFVTSFLAGP